MRLRRIQTLIIIVVCQNNSDVNVMEIIKNEKDMNNNNNNDVNGVEGEEDMKNNNHT